MTKKIRILATGDWIDSGFGTVMRNIFPRLARTGLFDIHLVGWHFRGDAKLAREAMDAGITLYPTVPPEEGTGDMAQDYTGAITCKRLIPALKPDAFFALGDPWQMVPFALDPVFNPVPKVFYVPIDTDVLSQPDLKTITKADILVLYSRFGVDVVKHQAPWSHPEFISHGVDLSVFEPLSAEEKKAFKDVQEYGVPNPWIVMVVGQNQVRKAHPRSMAAFKAATCGVFNDPEAEIVVDDVAPEGTPDWQKRRYSGKQVPFKPAAKWCEDVQQMRCEKCPYYRPDPKTANWVLHFHCGQQGAVGWNLVELAFRFGLQNRVRATQGTGANKGIPLDRLARMMATADTHLLLTHREGFGLPILEMMALGVPNVVTDYSSCSELLDQGGGVPVKVRDFDTSSFHAAVDANASIADAARGLRRLFDDREFHAAQSAKGRAFAAGLDWDAILPQWIALFRKLASVQHASETPISV